MAVTVRNIIPRKLAESAQTTQYTASNCRTIIDKFTVTNNGTVNRLFSCNLVAAGGSPSITNRVIFERQIAPNEAYACPELIGQCLEPGGFISTLTSATDLTLSATGREITL